EHRPAKICLLPSYRFLHVGRAQIKLRLSLGQCNGRKSQEKNSDPTHHEQCLTPPYSVARFLHHQIDGFVTLFLKLILLTPDSDCECTFFRDVKIEHLLDCCLFWYRNIKRVVVMTRQTSRIAIFVNYNN